MSELTDGGPAFPMPDGHEHIREEHPGREFQKTVKVARSGMSLLDWFAGMALANQYTQHETDPDKVAEWAYGVADAMLEARKQ